MTEIIKKGFFKILHQLLGQNNSTKKRTKYIWSNSYQCKWRQHKFVKYKQLSSKAENGLSKQLLSNFQAENSYGRKQLEPAVKNRVSYIKKKRETGRHSLGNRRTAKKTKQKYKYIKNYWFFCCSYEYFFIIKKFLTMFD